MRTKTIGAKNREHGMSQHPVFGVWHGMKERCECPTHHAYKNYGARGIKVCERWSKSFKAFWEDMGPTWQKGLDLDRINNDGNYEPGNCRWTTRRVNCNNRRRSVVINGKPLSQWAEETGIGQTTLLYRLSHGCPREHLFDKPDATRKFSSMT